MRTARRAVLVAAALNLATMPIYLWIVSLHFARLSWSGASVSLGLSAALLLGFNLWRDAPLRASELAFTVHNVAIVAALWLPSRMAAAANQVWMPFGAHKLGMLAVALLLPWFRVGLLNIAVFAAAAILEYYTLGPSARQHLPLEPWATVIYAAFAVGVLSFRVRQFALEAEALRVDADRAARQLVLAVVGSLPITLHAMDSQGRFILSEGKGLEAIGLGGGELVGHAAGEVFGDKPFIDAHGVMWSGRDVLARVFAGETLHGSTPYRGRELESTFVPLRDARGRVVRAAGISYDVTEARRLARERAQLLEREAAARSEAQAAAERLELLYDATGRLLEGPSDVRSMLQRIATRIVPGLADACSLYVVDRDGNPQRMASAGSDAVDLAAPAATGAPPPRLDPERGVGYVLTTGRAQLVTGLAGGPSPCAPGRAHSMVTAPIRARAEVVGAIALFACREGLCYGADTVALVEDLAHRIALVLHNVRLYEDAQHAVRVRDEFLALASHELRTPLTPLLASVQALEQVAAHGDLGRASPALLSRMLERIDRQARRLRLLVESMLDVVELQAGRLDLHRAPMDLAALARDVCADLGDALGRAGCTLTLSAPEPVVGRWDRQRLRVVVTHLLSNAIKYGPGRPIELTATGDGARARLVVTDHGIGVPPELAPKIFRRFERGVSVRSYGGLGLGLYIVKEIVDAHGGTIAVRSDPARPGATFTVELPLGPAPAEA